MDCQEKNASKIGTAIEELGFLSLLFFLESRLFFLIRLSHTNGGATGARRFEKKWRWWRQGLGLDKNLTRLPATLNSWAGHARPGRGQASG